MKIKKAVVLAAGLGARFLPLSKAVEKPLLPVGEKPMIQHVLEEIRDSGIKEVVIVIATAPEKSRIKAYFEKDKKLEEALQKNGQDELLGRLEQISKLIDGLSLKYIVQKKPLGNAHALFQAKKEIAGAPFALLFCDDIFEGRVPALKQLLDMFNTSERPIIGLAEVPENEISNFGIIEPEKIAEGVFKVKSIVEKPANNKAPSNLAVVGRYVFTPDIFEFLESSLAVGKEKEFYLTYTIALALSAGKTFYGLLLKGRWLKCGNIQDWLCSHLYIALRDSDFKKELKNILKTI